MNPHHDPSKGDLHSRLGRIEAELASVRARMAMVKQSIPGFGTIAAGVTAGVCGGLFLTSCLICTGMVGMAKGCTDAARHAAEEQIAENVQRALNYAAEAAKGPTPLPAPIPTPAPAPATTPAEEPVP